MKDKKSFIAYCDWIEVFDELPDETAGKLIKHLFAYVNDQDPKTDDAMVKLAFISLKQSLKRDLVKYEKYIEKQTINGSKGGRPKKIEEPKKPKPLFQNPTEPKKADSVNDSESVTVNDNVNDTIVIYKEDVSELENNFSMKEEVGKLLRATPEIVDVLLENFIQEQKAKDGFGRSLKEIRSHFVSWSKKNHNTSENGWDKLKQ